MVSDVYPRLRRATLNEAHMGNGHMPSVPHMEGQDKGALLMNPKQIGLGICATHKTPILGAINQPGIAGVCFECQEEAKPKTGRTVVVRRETGDTKATTAAPDGKVELEDVTDQHGQSVVGVARQDAIRVEQIAKGRAAGINVFLTLDEMFQPEIIRTLLTKVYDGIDDMPPPATIKEAKRVFGLQEKIEKLIKSMEK